MAAILTDRAEGVLTITLNRPDKLNALDEGMLGSLHEALCGAAQDDAVRALLLTGAGRGFCAGQDLEGVALPGQGREPALGEVLERFYNPIVRTLYTLEKPVVCAVNGVAAGAGANLALACDLVLAARSAKFMQAFAKIGLLPDSGGTFWLANILGMPRAKALALLALPLSAEDAQSQGLIWQVVDDAALLGEAQALARQLAQGPTQGLGLIKRALHQAAGNTLSAQLDVERDLQQQAGLTPDYAEGVQAFLEKRPPRFTGRPR